MRIKNSSIQCYLISLIQAFSVLDEKELKLILEIASQASILQQDDFPILFFSFIINNFYQEHTGNVSIGVDDLHLSACALDCNVSISLREQDDPFQVLCRLFDRHEIPLFNFTVRYKYRDCNNNIIEEESSRNYLLFPPDIYGESIQELLDSYFDGDRGIDPDPAVAVPRFVNRIYNTLMTNPEWFILIVPTVIQKATSVNIIISINGLYYKLRSLILHHGLSAAEGHYTCVYNSGINPKTMLDEWYEVDDDKDITLFTDFHLIKRNAYIFLYKKLYF